MFETRPRFNLIINFISIFFFFLPFWMRLPPSFTIILPTGMGKGFGLQTCTAISRVRIPTTARQSGSEVRLILYLHKPLLVLESFRFRKLTYSLNSFRKSKKNNVKQF